MKRTAIAEGPLVPLDILRYHLRIDHADDEGLILAYEAAAVAHIDGYRGVLGRAVLAQTWEIDLPAGTHRLPLPDVKSATASAGEVLLSEDARGQIVTLSEDAKVTFIAEAPDEIKSVACMIVKLLVAHWYENREAASAGAFSEVPFAAEALITSAKMVRV